MEDTKVQRVQFSDYIYILYKWKRIIISILLVAIGIGFAIAYWLPTTYRSTAVIMIPPESNMGLGGLTSLLGGKSSSSLGAKMLGTSNTSEDVLLGILNSRMALTNVIEKYDLINYYEIKEKNIDKTIKEFKDDILFESNEFNFIEISVINKNREISAEMANYFVRILDSLNIKINTENARNNRFFVEQRYNKNLLDLKNAEDSLYKFQQKYGIFAVPEQLEVSVKAAAELEAELNAKEIQSYLVKQNFGDNSPQYLGTLTEIKLLKDKVSELKNSRSLSSESNVLFPFKGIPDIIINYYRFYRDVEIQSKILEVILPMYEQAKVEEQKSIPTIMVIDKAAVPQIKYGPKKAFIILACAFITFFFLIIFAFRGEYLLNLKSFSNPLLEKERAFYVATRRIFGLKK